MDKINEYEYKVKVSGHLIDVVYIDPGFSFCGSISDNVSFRRPDEEGGWGISYNDLLRVVLLATWIRLTNLRDWRATKAFRSKEGRENVNL